MTNPRRMQMATAGQGEAGYTLWTFGSNSGGRLGFPSGGEKYVPTQVGDLTDWTTTHVSRSAGAGFIKSDGTLWSFGNYWGGSGTKSSPVQVGSETDWVKIAGGYKHTLAIRDGGTLWAFGLNTGGQLGDGSITNRATPVQIGSGTDWVTPVAGKATSMAIKSNGTLWTWGKNNHGQLGLGNTTNTSSPTQVGSLTTWRTGAVGEGHVGAIKTDGTLWMWGRAATYGHTGHGNTTDYSSPVQVGSLTNWSELSLSLIKQISGAVKTDGTIWMWGRNYYGQLGRGNLTHYSSPVQLGSSTTWKQLGIGAAHAGAVTTDGKIFMWGRASTSCLGLNNTTNYSSPVQIGSDTDWAAIDCGFYSTHTIREA